MIPENQANKNASAPTKVSEERDQETTVRGSGFTYDEAKDPTDQSEPIKNVEAEDIVDLPDLGKPGRP